MMETVRVKFLRGTSLGGGKDAAVGDVIDLDRRQFAQFAQQGRVVEVQAAAIEQAVAGDLAAEAGGDPLAAPVKRKGKKNA